MAGVLANVTSERRLRGGWLLLAMGVALPTLVALAVVLGSFAGVDSEVQGHLFTFVLPRVALNTVWLVAGVAAGTLLLGTSLAWLTSVCEFPGRRLFAWALMLPLAVPGYVIAFVAIGLLEYAGPVQTALREWLGPDVWFPRIRSRAGITIVMSLVLYPYVYLIARNAFLTQGRRALEVAQSLGYGRWNGFWRVALPLARPWIVAGVTLVAMETLADFGTVAVFNYDTFTTAIYHAWFHLFSIDSALQLSSVLLIGVFAIVVLEQHMRARARYTQLGGADTTGRIRLRPRLAWLASAYATAVLGLGFALPFGQLVLWSLGHYTTDLDARYVAFAGRTILLAGSAAVLIAAAALLLVYAVRNGPPRAGRVLAKVATLGYALPGTVLAVGIFVPVATLNNALQWMLDGLLGEGAPALLLQSTLLTMLLAYMVRFLAVGYAPVESHMMRITQSLDEASRSLGIAGMAMLRQVHLPILRGGMLTGMVLVFVDVMKEMPITLMTRPFGWETLAVRVFELTSEGEWERAALPAIAIVGVGLIPVALLTRGSEHVARA